MTTKKQKAAAEVKRVKRAERIRLLKVQELEEGKHLVELEVHGAPDPIPEVTLPTEPILLDYDYGKQAPEPPEHKWLKWLKGIWGSN